MGDGRWAVVEGQKSKLERQQKTEPIVRLLEGTKTVQRSKMERLSCHCASGNVLSCLALSLCFFSRTSLVKSYAYIPSRM